MVASKSPSTPTLCRPLIGSINALFAEHANRLTLEFAGTVDTERMVMTRRIENGGVILIQGNESEPFSNAGVTFWNHEFL